MDFDDDKKTDKDELPEGAIEEALEVEDEDEDLDIPEEIGEEKE